MSGHLDLEVPAEALACQLEIDAAVAGISRAEIEEDMGPLTDMVADAQRSLAAVQPIPTGTPGRR